MKRAISMLGAAAIALGSLVVAPAANAAPPAPPAGLGCSLITDLSHLTPPNGFPRDGHYYYCGTSSTFYRTPSASAFGTMPAHLKTILINNGTYLMIGDTQAEINTYTGSVSNDPGTLGKTLIVTWPGYGTYVFSTSWETVSSSDIGTVLRHERGHALDYAFGSLNASPTGISQKPTSNFWTQVNLDWTWINAQSVGTIFPHGIPPKKINKPGGTWTAYAPPPVGTPNRNQIILNDLFPWLFGSGATEKGELYAHLHAMFGGNFLNDCPYNITPAETGANTLRYEEVFTHFIQTAETNSTSYFGRMYNDFPNFTP